MKKFGSKTFKAKLTLDRLFQLAGTNKYSAHRLAKFFHCERKTIYGTLNRNGIKVVNLGKFKKKYFYNDKFFATLNNVSAYWAGFVAADGCLYNHNGNNKVLSIGLNKIDIAHLKKFQKAIGDKSKISCVQSNNSVRVGIRSDIVFDSLVAMGIIPNKSAKMDKVKIKGKLMCHFIRGFFDGDGCVSGKRITHLQFQLLGHKPLLIQLQKVLIKKCSVKKVSLYPAVYNKDCKISRLQYTGSQIFRILDFLYKNSTKETRLDRKYKKYQILKKKFWLI